MRILILYIKNSLKNFFRSLYWLYRLSRANLGKNLKISFPIRVEGKGKIQIGNNSSISKNVLLAAGMEGEIILGDNCRIDENVQLIVGKGGKIIFGNNCWIMSGTVIRTRSHTFSFGDNVIISTNVQIFSRETEAEGFLSVGSGTHINDYAMLDITGDLIIGKEVAFGQYAIAFTHDHRYDDPSKAAWKGGLKTGQIRISDRAWIGAKVTIMPNVSIGKRCVIATSAVVTKDCPSESICAGIPAKIVKNIEV